MILISTFKFSLLLLEDSSTDVPTDKKSNGTHDPIVINLDLNISIDDLKEESSNRTGI